MTSLSHRVKTTWQNLRGGQKIHRANTSVVAENKPLSVWQPRCNWQCAMQFAHKSQAAPMMAALRAKRRLHSVLDPMQLKGNEGRGSGLVSNRGLGCGQEVLYV